MQNLGRAHHAAGRWREALASYEQALQIRERATGIPQWVLARNRLQIAEALLELARVDEATAQLDRAAAIAGGPDVPGFVLDYLAVVRAELRWWQGDRLAAIAELDELLARGLDRDVERATRSWLAVRRDCVAQPICPVQPTGTVFGWSVPSQPHSKLSMNT